MNYLAAELTKYQYIGKANRTREIPIATHRDQFDFAISVLRQLADSEITVSLIK